MDEIKLHHVFTYRDFDRAFWAEHLEGWVPARIVDAHIHIIDPKYRTETVTEELRRSYWVMELDEMMGAATAEHCFRTVFPNRKISCVGFGYPSLGWDIAGSNAYVCAELPPRGWHPLALVCPTWTAAQLETLLAQPGVLGVKPYYAMIGYDAQSRDKYLEASIFDFLPHHQLEVLNARRAWVTLHIPRAGRLGDPANLREIREIRRRYPAIQLVIAHLGRCYTRPHAEEGLPPLADDPGLYFDNSAVLNPDVHALALQHLGPGRILYGTDNPIFFMRGRQRWEGRRYIQHTSYPFHFNTNREAPDIEARYTLFMYEALKALKDACQQVGIGPDGVEQMFFRNAEKLIAGAQAGKGSAGG
jgi:hypothetical protein